MTPDQIKTLQQQLNAKGAGLKVDGILGPKTTAAMNQFATTAAASAPSPTGMSTQDIMALQNQLNAQGAGLKVDGILGPKTTSAMNSAVSKSLSTNPATQSLVQQNSPDAILNAYMSGDWSGVNDVTGQPFAQDQIDDAVRRSEAVLAPAYKAQEAFDRANIESTLGGAQDQYNQFLQGEATDFKAEKEQQDQTAADQGVLFSGSRYQKLNNLSDKYEQRQANQLSTLGRQVGDTARNYQYKYGDQAAGKLSDYYNLGGQTYNANVAGGKVGNASTLSSVYNPSAYKFQGTAPVANKANAQVRAAGLLANRANKLTPYGYKNQF